MEAERSRLPDQKSRWLSWWLAAIALLAVATLVQALLAAKSSRDASTARPGVEPATAGQYLLVQADESGVVTMEPGGDLVGVSRTEGVVWRDYHAGDRLVVSCVVNCPAAVASGSPNMASETMTGETAYWHLSPEYSQEVTQTPGTIVTALSRQSFVQLSSSGTLTVPQPPDGSVLLNVGSDIRSLTRIDPTRQLLISSSGEGSWVTTLEQAGRGWVVHSVPSHADAACVGPSSTAYIEQNSIHVDSIGLAPLTINLSNAGACILNNSEIIVVVLREVSGERLTTFSSYSLPSESFQWSRTVRGLRLPSQSPVTGETVMVDNAAAVVVSRDGTVARVYESVSDAQFVDNGELVLLLENGTVEWLRP